VTEKLLIEACLDKWHDHLKGEFEGGLDELLADNVVFYSPVVFTPLEGKDLAKLYLSAAGNTFSEGDPQKVPGENGSNFRYIKEVMSGDHIMLEFEATIDGTYVNGVDIMTWNNKGKISEFKVMIRPLQAVNLVHAQMKTILERMQG
jgi:hypothetical protein